VLEVKSRLRSSTSRRGRAARWLEPEMRVRAERRVTISPEIDFARFIEWSLSACELALLDRSDSPTRTAHRSNQLTHHDHGGSDSGIRAV